MVETSTVMIGGLKFRQSENRLKTPKLLMQTFLCFLVEEVTKNGSKEILDILTECFLKTAQALDYKRLGKQRVEAMQALNLVMDRVKIDGEYKSAKEVKDLLDEHDKDSWPYNPSYGIVKKRINNPGWKNHPVVLQWKDYPEALQLYFNVMVNEWIDRGYKNNLPLEKFDYSKLQIPPYLKNEEFVKIHRQNLIRKDANFYGKIWKDLTACDGYMWYSKGVYRRIINTIK